MKKVSKISKEKMGVVGATVVVALLVLVLFFVIFNGKVVNCKMTSDQSKNGYILKTNYKIKANGKNVSKVEINEEITSKDDKKLNNFKEQLENQYEYNKKKYGGYTYKVTKSGGKVVSKVVIDYNKIDMKKFIEANQAIKKYTKNNKLTLDGAKKLYATTGATCK